MPNSILVDFFRADTKEFIQKVFEKMTYGNEGRLHDWGNHILAHKDTDPAKGLLQALIFADAPRILVDLADPTLDIIPDLFHDTTIASGGGFRQLWTDDKYASWIDSENYYYDAEAEGLFPDSTTLVHLANYLRGDLGAAKPLLYAISNRIWRHVYDKDTGYSYYPRLAQAAFLLHTYLFHYKGWSPNTTDAPVGALHDMRSHLAGKTLTMTTSREWDDCASTPHYGLPEFSVMPRVSKELLAVKGAHLHQRLAFQCGSTTRGCELVLGDFGDDGVALLTQFEGHEVAYFLSWPYDYEHPLQLLFNIFAITEAAHAPAPPKHWRTREEELEEEIEDDWDTFHSI